MRASKTKGFTLVEVLASVLILSGTIITIIKYSADGLATSMEIERITKSTLLAESEMEKIQNALRKSFDTDFPSWASALGGNFLANRTTTDLSSTLKRVEVSVGYDANGDTGLGTDEIMFTVTTRNVKRN